MLADDGITTTATISGTDTYERLGTAFVIHRIDVVMGHDRVEALEMIGPFDPRASSFPTTAYDAQGNVESSTAQVDLDGVWTFGSGEAVARLQVSSDGLTMKAEWTRPSPDGAERQVWMRLRFARISS